MSNKGTVKKKKHIILRIFLILLLILALFCAFELYISKYWLTTTNYTISSSRIKSSFRVVQLTDLHNSVFGKDNEKLVSEVAEQSPDLILITGDLVNSKKNSDTTIATNLISDLSSIAPVYVSYGNQEYDLVNTCGTDITSLYTDAGATVLERSYVEIDVNGQTIRLGGIYGYCLNDKFAQETHREDESAWLKEFQDTEEYSILMCHMPIGWLNSGSLEDWDIDAVFAGHAHGGQVRIPFVGGLWAPDQGWFPGPECGVYTTSEEGWAHVKEQLKEYGNSTFDNSYYETERPYKESNLILSRGLGNTDKIPRFNNIPEIVVTDFVPEES